VVEHGDLFGEPQWIPTLLSPVFLQELLGYSAWKAGRVQAPRGIGSMTSMMLVGNLARFGIDTRKFIGLGFTLITIGCWYSSRSLGACSLR
jgi:MFS transporter, DHA2 family, multidrug resistance protein